ncbi:MAG: BlaI/MecI/CopY family transcriptional regulator [Anaerolineae bacterium]|nr:BlaI/MecI/CopY family transcriptional regulator [Anaerolineae bacterium]
MRQGIQSFKLDQRGLARVFGELEARIMDTVWEIGPATVQDVCDRLGPEQNYKTVMTVMNRLVEKHFLLRERDTRAFVYSAAASRDAFVQDVSRHVVEGLVQDFGPAAIAQFLAVMDASPDTLAALRRLIEKGESGDHEA